MGSRLGPHPVMYHNARWAAQGENHRKRRTSKMKVVCKLMREKASGQCEGLIARLMSNLQSATEQTAHSTCELTTAAIIELCTTIVDKWPGERPNHWNRYLQDLRKKKRKAYRTMRRKRDLVAKREQGRIDNVMRKEDRPARSIRSRRETAAVQAAPLGEKEKAIQMDRRGRQKPKETRGRKGTQVRPATYTKCLYKIHEQARSAPVESKMVEVWTDFGCTVEEDIRKEKRGKAVGNEGTHVEMYKSAPPSLTCWWRTIGRLRILPPD